MGKQTITLAWRALCALVFLTCAAKAQVTEIRADGSSVTYAGPVLSTIEGTRPLVPAAPVRIRADRAPARAALRLAAIRHDMSPSLVEAVAWQESRWNQDAVSPKGARGVMQLMPGTARSLGVDARDLGSNVDGGAAYLAQMLRRFDGDIVRSLAAYNAGPEAVARYNGVPPYRETRAFVDGILDRLAGVQR
ncbi:MAG TPA: lytic transglycosylase domain-containing protein [Rhizomicrobium sp.]|nr:lytic transglycosylase domain-containing protein [Rhizomicrobium sp.]